jgi:hypothetical protein
MKFILSLTIVLCASVGLFAQQPTPTPTAAKPLVQRRCCGPRFPKRVVTGTSTAQPTQAAPDFFVGDAKVDVTKDETVVRLAMAQHGSVLIELPANDGPRYIIPGDPEMATVDEKALERNKRAIVVRPGTLFVPPLPNHRARTPAATVTAQMRSGLVVTFLFYPVEDLAQNVHRCVLTYNRDEVVARRRAAGLPVNLDTATSQERRIDTGQSTAPTSISVNSDDDKPLDESAAKPRVATDSIKQSKKEETEKGLVTASSSLTPSTAPKETSEVSDNVKTATQSALERALKKPKQFKKWTKPVHGLALAVLEQSDPKENFRVAVVAVKNASSEVLKVSPGGPDLSLEMLDDQGKPVNVQSIKHLHLQTSEATGTIAAGTTVYYAIAYTSPVLGVHQQLRVAISQTAAADEPASLTLAGNIR